MSYAVEVLPEARRHLNRLQPKHLPAVLEFIYAPIADNPQRVGKPLRLELDGLYRALTTLTHPPT